MASAESWDFEVDRKAEETKVISFIINDAETEETGD